MGKFRLWVSRNYYKEICYYAIFISFDFHMCWNFVRYLYWTSIFCVYFKLRRFFKDIVKNNQEENDIPEGVITFLSIVSSLLIVFINGILTIIIRKFTAFFDYYKIYIEYFEL